MAARAVQEALVFLTTFTLADALLAIQNLVELGPSQLLNQDGGAFRFGAHFGKSGQERGVAEHRRNGV